MKVGIPAGPQLDEGGSFAAAGPFGVGMSFDPEAESSVVIPESGFDLVLVFGFLLATNVGASSSSEALDSPATSLLNVEELLLHTAHGVL